MTNHSTAEALDRALAWLVEAERTLPAGHPQTTELADVVTTVTRIRRRLDTTTQHTERRTA